MGRNGRASILRPLGSRTANGMLVGMALLVLLMPTNYRAGTETDHPHAFFQEVIDLATGTPHEHGSHVGAAPETGNGDHHHDRVTASTTTPATISPFLAADIPLAAAVEAAGSSLPNVPIGIAHDAGDTDVQPLGAIAADANRDAVVASLSPNLPSVTDLTPAAEKGSAILVLTTMLAGILLSGGERRNLWSPVTRLLAVADRVEAPPPRIAPA